jgi:hypothetical protein
VRSLSGTSVLGQSTSDKPFIHHFAAQNVDKAVHNCLLWWIRCGQVVDNPVIVLLERAKREEEKRKKILCTAS